MNHQINIDEAIAIALDLIIFIVTKQINNHINKNGNNK